ncbi:MAG: sensor histidine kinase, partial [Chitinophagaceae bacterium]
IIKMVENVNTQKPTEEYIFQKNNLYFDVTVTPLLNKNGMLGGTIVIFKNITHLKNTEKQLIVQAEELKNSNQIKDKIFSIVAHDLRTPLLNMNEVLSLTTQGLINPEELQEMLPMIQKDIQVTAGFLENLLHWSKSQLQGQNLAPQVFNLTELVTNIIQLFSLNAKDKQIVLNNHLPDSLMVYADKNTIQLVVRNLLSNALKFCRQNDTITVTATGDNGFCKVCIADTGMGIAPENVDKLFSLNNFTTKGSKNEMGTGLGLVLCKEFVEKNGGKIWVNSELGNGAKFCFTIPITQ